MGRVFLGVEGRYNGEKNGKNWFSSMKLFYESVVTVVFSGRFISCLVWR